MIPPKVFHLGIFILSLFDYYYYYYMTTTTITVTPSTSISTSITTSTTLLLLLTYHTIDWTYHSPVPLATHHLPYLLPYSFTPLLLGSLTPGASLPFPSSLPLELIKAIQTPIREPPTRFWIIHQLAHLLSDQTSQITDHRSEVTVTGQRSGQLLALSSLVLIVDADRWLLIVGSPLLLIFKMLALRFG